MVSNTPSLESLIKNVDELYAIAGLLELKIEKPLSQFRLELERGLERKAPKIGSEISRAMERGKIEEALIAGTVLAVGWVGASAIDFAKNSIAKKKAREELLPLYKEIAVKTQAITLQLSEDNKKLNKLLWEEKLLNTNNQHQIKVLKKRIEKGDAIVQRFMALQAKS